MPLATRGFAAYCHTLSQQKNLQQIYLEVYHELLAAPPFSGRWIGRLNQQPESVMAGKACSSRHIAFETYQKGCINCIYPTLGPSPIAATNEGLQGFPTKHIILLCSFLTGILGGVQIQCIMSFLQNLQLILHATVRHVFAEEQPQNELVIRIQPNEAIYYKVG